MRRASYGDLIRPALRRFPQSPTLLAIAGSLLLEAGRRRAALRLFRRAAEARTTLPPPSDDGHGTGEEPIVDDPDADGANDLRTLRVLAGYPPAPPPGAPRAWRHGAFDAYPWRPLLVNLALLEQEQHGRQAARDRIARYADSSSVVMTAASLRAIGDVDDACALLERELFRPDRRADRRSVLNALLALHAGMGRMRDALAVVALVMKSYEEPGSTSASSSRCSSSR